jgi:multiple sugar transport system substrate-binding protein
MRSKVLSLSAAVLALGLTAACGGGSGSDAKSSTGPIKIWLSNNPEELTWGKAMVKEWNAGHSNEKVTAQEIPAGKTSEEVIGAAITAGNAPCLVFNTSPAAVPGFEKQGGLVPLDGFSGATKYVEDRSGAAADQYKSPDGKFYQIPWKQNPVMIFYNKDLFKKAGISPTKPPLATYDQFLAASKKIVDSKAAPSAIAPAPSSEFFQSWFDFYPLYAAESGGKQLIENGKSTFNDAAGKDVWNFWAQMYKNGYAPKEAYSGDAFATKKTAMAVVGPWAIAVYKGKVNWGVVPVPTKTQMSPSQVHSYTDAKNVSVYSACKHQKTAWNVLKYATSKQQDGKLLEMTGQMPIRKDLPTTYASYFKSHPEYTQFADQASRTVEVPNVTNSVQIWQQFRDNYSAAVIFAKTSVDEAIAKAASKADSLAGQS